MTSYAILWKQAGMAYCFEADAPTGCPPAEARDAFRRVFPHDQVIAVIDRKTRRFVA